MNVYLCIHNTDKSFDDALNHLFIEYPDLNFVDFRGKPMNWYYYDFKDFAHPPGIRGNPNDIRLGIFNNTVDAETLLNVSADIWDDIYSYLKLYDSNFPSDLFEVKEYLHGKRIETGFEEYIDLAIFFTVVGLTGMSIEWCFKTSY